MAETISIFRLSIALVPVAMLLIWLWVKGHRIQSSLQGLARMLIQLSVVGYLLVFLFESDSSWISLAALSVMTLAASMIAMRTSRQNSWRQYVHVLVAVVVGGGVTLAIVTQGVLSVTPWYNPRILIPLAGMTFSNCMNALSLAIERLEAPQMQAAQLKASGDQASGDQASGVQDSGVQNIEGTNTSSRDVVSVALIPITNSLFAVGVVSIPGMMTGQVLAGVSPLIAARYQIMIMCLVFASAGWSLMVFMWLRQTAGPVTNSTKQGDLSSDEAVASD